MQIKNKSRLEFIVIMAALMSLVALSIDALLPAMNAIGVSINSSQYGNNQFLITMIFLGLGVGQLLAGPLSDSFGRKPIIYIGFLIFVIASFICVSATSVEVMILGRVLQGIGLSAPRTISVAMVRDSFSGDYMAKIMSFITVIFILVPIVAPAFGKIILDIYDWQSIFYSQLLFGVVVMYWLYKRQPETLKEENKTKFTSHLFIDGFLEFIKHKQSVVFTLFSGFISGAFMVYLSASQKIFHEQYHLIEEFPYIFAGLAITIGGATFLNGRLVMKFGMLNLVRIFTILFTIIPVLYIILFYGSENPNVFVLLLFLGLQFFSIGFLFGNTNALAMEPIGHIAGVGAAISGFVSTIMAVPIATFIGSYITKTALPLFIGFFICGLLSFTLLLFTKKR